MTEELQPRPEDAQALLRPQTFYTLNPINPEASTPNLRPYTLGPKLLNLEAPFKTLTFNATAPSFGQDQSRKADTTQDMQQNQDAAQAHHRP